MNKLTVLQQKGTIEVIFLLVENEKAIITELKEVVGQTALYNALNKLLNEKIVEESREHPFNKRVFKLTAKGKKVALLLQEIEKILQSE